MLTAKTVSHKWQSQIIIFRQTNESYSKTKWKPWACKGANVMLTELTDTSFRHNSFSFSIS